MGKYRSAWSIGDRITYRDPSDGRDYAGSIIEVGYAAIKVKWDDGERDTFFALDGMRMGCISKMVDGGLKPGDTLELHVNQGEREAMVLARIGDEVLIEYEMPNGTSALVIAWVNDLSARKSTSYRSLPLKWLRAVVDAQSGWIGQPQPHWSPKLPPPSEMLAQREARRLGIVKEAANAE